MYPSTQITSLSCTPPVVGSGVGGRVVGSGVGSGVGGRVVGSGVGSDVVGAGLVVGAGDNVGTLETVGLVVG